SKIAKIIHPQVISDINYATATTMPYNGASNGSGGGGGGGIVTDGPQNKKIRTGVQQPGESDPHMHARVVQQQSQQQALLVKTNDDLRRKRPESTRPNHILLFTIINPFYPITVYIQRRHWSTATSPKWFGK
ncbi:uncharacterized protein LOC119674535, partial [Teleopsis dalmanni]|uniref:uncharacterized protein LOC119674535 n=1 Tax=Teleopsis dalmanni TaxID=139649 RepID=UPI0018CF1C83